LYEAVAHDARACFATYQGVRVMDMLFNVMISVWSFLFYRILRDCRVL
jgi:hypothetical protein